MAMIDTLSPLTPKEQETAEKYVKHVDKFLSRYHLSPVEWYDVAVVGYLSTIQYVHRRRKELLEQGPWPVAMLYYGMNAAVGRERRIQRAEKRGGGVVTVSLDEQLIDGDGSPLEVLIPRPDDVEKTVLDRDLIERCLNMATPYQREILMDVAKGFTQKEIGEKTGRSRKAISMQLTRLRKSVRVLRDGLTSEYFPPDNLRGHRG